MNYPVWDVPLIGSAWVIGAIAIFHIMISHFAVGGGLYLPMAERKARLAGRDDMLKVVRRHSAFFLVLTGCFGAVSGVGIWFSIGLANPEATSTLIHNFVFGWAIEWVFFMIELTAAAVYYYTWDKIDPRKHLQVGWVYAAASFLTLVIINGILAFMLTPGSTWLSVAGTGQEASVFWNAFFNPTYWPSLVLRTLVCVSLAGVWALVTASRIDGYAEPRLKTEFVRWSAKWLLPSFVLMPVALLWYLASVPESQRALLSLGISTIGQGTFTQVTRAALVTVMTSGTILALVYVMAWRDAKGFTLGRAVAILALALAATASTEQAREMLRKPYVVGQHMYSNGIRRSEVERFNTEGYLASTMWTASTPYVRVAEATEPSLVDGELMFRGQCMACHTVDGYRSMRQLLSGRDRQAIDNILKVLYEAKDDSPYKTFMPPLVGTERERVSLAMYLDHIARGGDPHPAGAPEPSHVAFNGRP